jgi:hypothetical protein
MTEVAPGRDFRSGATSALGPLAGIPSLGRQVRFVPESGHRGWSPARLLCADIVAKVEIRTTLKISRKLMRCCPSCQVLRGLIATKPPTLGLIGKLNQRIFLRGTIAALSSPYWSLKLEVIYER